jgi:DNA-binding LacI/PurR family transcriptional regulator
MNHITDIIVSHNSFISLHVQLHNQLRQLILSGRWATGTRIPSETQFAEHLNVSRTTVRLALQQAELEGLVERIPGKGTFVTRTARKESRSRMIGFVTWGFDSETHLLLLSGAEDELKTNGHRIIFTTVQDRQEEAEVLKRFKEDDIAGLLMWPNANASRMQQENALLYQDVHVPIVLMDRQIYGLDCDFVTSDNFGGAKALMRHLIDLGHQRIVFLTHHEMELLPVIERYRAYQEVLQEAGCTPEEPWLIGTPGKEIGSAGDMLRSSFDANSREIHQIRDHMANAAVKPTAIFALNDYLAVLALQAMRMLNLTVPDDVSIGGFDDIDIAAYLQVPLTTVAQDPFTIGKRAARLLIDRLEGIPGPTRCEIIPTQLRIRSSTSVPVRVQT